MKALNRVLVLISVCALSMMSCRKKSDDDSTASSQPTTVTGALALATTTLSAAIPGQDSTELRNFSESKLNAASFTIADLTATQFDSTAIGTNAAYFSTPKSYLKYIINKDEDVDPEDGMGLIARFKQKISSGMCPILAQFPDADSNGVPDVGTGVITLPNFSDDAVKAALLLKCPGMNAASLENASGVNVGYGVTDVSKEDGSLYSVKGTISFGNTGSINNVFYFLGDGKNSRFAFAELPSSNGLVGDRGGDGSFTLFDFDGNTMRFDFFGGENDGHYRIFYDSSTRDTTMFAWTKMGGNQINYLGLRGNRKETEVAFSITSSGSTETLTNGQACVDVSASTPAFKAAPAAGKCGSASVIDFSSTPGVLTYTGVQTATADNFTSKVVPQFSSSDEVFTSKLLP